SNTGGVTDGSYIKKYCEDVFELGLKENTMHKINEYVELNDLNNLIKIYTQICFNFVKGNEFIKI
ncbi:MAG TPA: M20/M25/M40 family metallo-hydrolase, partial [Leptospiraceae bacterium]|nr:M20/M25/M40 family metallo-hydrolase [Leptospiraceae bacterium]